MSFKLAFKNIRKSIKDYSIYFFTLVVAVSIFYIFNSMDAQESMLMLNDSKKQIIQSMVYILNYLSIFISIILGFLIVYSNNFLIKRRKKEFGLYLTLGMSKRKVSIILAIETMLVGLISLGIGLVVGIFVSQFLSILTAKLFEVNMMDYKFVFSSSALIKTILYFGVIFLFVMIFNVITISKNKLINLLTAGKQNEKVKFRNKYTTIISFILSVCLIYYAYHLLFNGALLSMDSNFLKMIVSGALGTLLLFFSISGFFLKIFEIFKKIYYKNLNMFILKQVNSKFNTSVISTTIICLMLLLTIGILSGSISLINVYNNGINNTNITDFTIEEYESNCTIYKDGECVYTKQDILLGKVPEKKFFSKYVKDYVYYELYFAKELTMKDLIGKDTLIDLKKQYGDTLEMGTNLSVISESDYNKIMKLYDKEDEIINLDSNEYILTAGVDMAIKIFNEFYTDNKSSITINGKTLVPGSDKIIHINLKNYSSESNFGTIIVSDEIIHDMKLQVATMIGNYVDSDDVEKTEKEFFNEMSSVGFVHNYYTRLAMQETNVTIKTFVIFIGLYVGIVFAISSATILAIGELSASSDNKERFKVLRQIGADEKMINKSLFTQIAITFVTPLIVALFHAYFGLKQLNGIIEAVGHVDLSANILITALFISIIYGGYFIATYLCSKRFIKE